MDMKSLVQGTDYPRTKESLIKDMQSLGVRKGMVLLVHSSLKSIGWVNGGAKTVILALMETVTDEGTILFQAHSADLSDPSEWGNPAIPESWWETVRQTMPPFDPKTTSTYNLGKIPEQFRTFPGVLRSCHPSVSVSAWGKDAEYITSNHSLDYGFGQQSPLAKACKLNASVLFIGTGFDSHTSFHLAETLSGVRKHITKGAPVAVNGEQMWKTYSEIDYDDEDFERIGNDFKKETEILEGKIGSAPSLLFNQKDSVDFAVDWLKRYKSN
ncbi:aminoglycoside N(3)-acetyltransferase [Pseudalkalibacillus decolorationis]|uniref:aminoglycoside N(3)-acetyltransferase n=1 Tax=Pseudalkalibacillus decolorationis TaxID=163879 RepID=UPI0021486E15|nr:AAC(3) family N-acetyltransferase [Pseudalkalibacillus decolorationis]